MGSTSKRNPKDQVQIGLASSGGASTGHDIKCPAQFNIRLSKDFKLIDGSLLTMRDLDGTLTIYYGNKILASLDEKRNTLIKQCIESGIIYEGVIVIKGERIYALFKRRAA